MKDGGGEKEKEEKRETPLTISICGECSVLKAKKKKKKKRAAKRIKPTKSSNGGVERSKAKRSRLCQFDWALGPERTRQERSLTGDGTLAEEDPRQKQRRQHNGDEEGHTLSSRERERNRGMKFISSPLAHHGTGRGHSETERKAG